MLEGRYRIVGLLGRGGMGEVYKADDLKLSQTVALKFLPEALATNGAALARFHREVRVARHVSHRNVCRVYDVGETGGHSFLSMEYVKGEELSSLLRRIGRLPHDKALEIARQLCAGLAAAHDNDVLHRDLKPANVMIDGEGNVRILDFGLAGIEKEFGDDELRAGTPAYMAPEQLAGKNVSKQSDIYALGLILYEVFTGKRAYEAQSISELVDIRKSESPTNPSHIVKDIDPIVERVILRCLEHEPSARPSSAIQVAAMLPGGDPLAAALAAGETPSPEMVAAAPKEGVLRPGIAFALLATTLVLLTVAVWLAGKVMLYRRVPLDKPPDVLQERAREIIRNAGYTDPPIDSEYGFFTNYSYLDYIFDNDKSSKRWDALSVTQPPALCFWYRQSPRYLEPFNRTQVEITDPPADVSGMTGTWMDTRGRLIQFYGVPQQKEPNPQAGAEPTKPNWSQLFNAAGLDQANFKPIQSEWTPPFAYDLREAWEGVYPLRPDIKLRIEAASYHGKPVYFELIDPWDTPIRQITPAFSGRTTALFTILIGMVLTIIIGGIVLAVRNIRLGRGDRKGAFVTGIIIFFLRLIESLFVHHVPTFGEWGMVMRNVADALFSAALFWLLYIALEPLVRRKWPGRIISWTRLLAGDFRNPLVGRDILIGAVAGTFLIVIQLVLALLPERLGWPSVSIGVEPASRFLGWRYAIPVVANQAGSAFMFGFGFLCLLLLLSIVLRKERIAIVAMWLLFSVALMLAWGHTLAYFVAPLGAAVLLFPLVRSGLLAMISAQFFHHFWILFPMTFSLTSWQGGSFALGLAASLALLIFAFYISLGGQPLLRGTFLDE